jgi:long-subunit acyl-CoA synthetase (AMP-forming)
MNGRYRNSGVPLEEVKGTVGTMILERAIEWPNHTVFAHRNGSEYKTVSWNMFYKDIISIASFLHSVDIQKGDRVAVLSPNSYAMLVWEMAVTSMGAISVPIFCNYDIDNIDYILLHSEPSAIYIDGEERLCKFEACSARPNFEIIVTSRESKYIKFENCLNNGSSELYCQLAKEVTSDDVCFIQYTSGTTGKPKGVMLTHRNIISQRKALGKVWEIPRDSRFLSYLPWHHSYGGLFERFTALHHGAAIYLEDSLGKDINRLIANWQLVKPTHFFSVPKIYRALVTESKLNAEIKQILFHPELCFVFTAAAPLSRDCGDYFNKENIPVLEGWGLTETSPTVTMTRADHPRIYSYVGEPIPGCEILTTEDNEVLVKGPNVMKGYYKNPERTAKAIDHYGWFHTGDLGEITDYGLKLRYRRDGLFKLANGEKVSSIHVENILSMSPHWILHPIVFGSGENYVSALIFPNFRNLEAWAQTGNIQLPGGWALSEDKEIRQLFRDEVEKNMLGLSPPYLRVRSFVIIPEELTVENGGLTPSMKVIRHHVQEKYGDWIHTLFRPQKHPSRMKYIVSIKYTNNTNNNKDETKNCS